MARNYSPKSFFRHAPNAMLKRYFDKQGVLTEHDFSEVSETKIEPIYQAWLSLPDTQRGEMERDFKEIDALACEGGVKAIMDEAEWHAENLADILGELEDLHEKAFWVFLERPKYWPAASAFCRADAISSSQWNECRTVSHASARVDDASIRDLAQPTIPRTVARGDELSYPTARAACEPQALDGGAVLFGGTMKRAVVKRRRMRADTLPTERKPGAGSCRWRSMRTTALARRGACAFGLLQAA